MAGATDSVDLDSQTMETFISITEATPEVAVQMLKLCNGNLTAAIDLFFESGGENPTAQASENTVRAPIPPQQICLVESPVYGDTSARPAAVFDTFRDFKVETQRQEEILMSPRNGNDQSRKTFEDLFRPPLELVFHGDFQQAKDKAEAEKKWLMVNIQNTLEFSCQMMNRDVWSNDFVKDVIRKNFVFFQVYSNSTEAMRYMSFYPVTRWPYVAILDPRTGEKLAVWHTNLVNQFVVELKDFLDENPGPASSAIPWKKFKASWGERSSDGIPGDWEGIVDIHQWDEEAQLEAAIRRSLVQYKSLPSDSSLGVTYSVDDEISREQSEIMGDQDPDADLESESEGDSIPDMNDPRRCNTQNKEPVAAEGGTQKVQGPNTNIVLRYPDGTREEVVLCPASKLKDLIEVVSSKGYSSTDFRLVADFPKRVISAFGSDTPLDQLSLHARDTVFVELQ